MKILRTSLVLMSVVLAPVLSGADTPAPPVLFNTTFESGSIGKIEKLSETEFRLHLKGQQDSRGRNRQATWFSIRLNQVGGRELTLRLTSFRGEYNDRPSRGFAGAWYRPVFSEDGETWQHVADATWDEPADEITFKVQPRGDTLWVSHVPPYTHSRLLRFLSDVRRSPHARIEIIGQSVQARDLHLVTVTNFAVPDANKKIIWMQARQHAWEAGTSFILEGALRFITSNDPAAVKLRDENIFIFVPMINPDGVVLGEVRFNLNGFDPNRQWGEVDLRDPRWLERNPEIWYVKKALIAQHSRQPIAIGLNMHNTEMNEYLETMVDQEPQHSMLHRFFALAVENTSFDPSRPKLTVSVPGAITGPGYTTSYIWHDARIPMMLLEQRVGPSRKLGRIASSEDRMNFGRELIALMAEVVK